MEPVLCWEASVLWNMIQRLSEPFISFTVLPRKLNMANNYPSHSMAIGILVREKVTKTKAKSMVIQGKAEKTILRNII